MIQGFSGGLLNRQLIYQTDLPSFQRDFASLKTLDHGTGPAISFTRGSNATYFDANGVLQTAGNNVPRFDHDPSTGASLGLLIEEARTNSIRNSQAGGSTNGVIGSGGAMPTNWSITPNANGVTSEVVGTGSEDGLAYIDIKVSGTPTASGGVTVFFESASQVAAANSQTWCGSFYARLVDGSLSNVTIPHFTTGRTAAGATVGTQFGNQNITPTSAPLKTQRSTVVRTFSDAGVERVTTSFGPSYTSGQAIDLTLRIAAPQLEQGAFATSYIPTTTAAATRAADSAVVTPISSFFNASEGTLLCDFTTGADLISMRGASVDNGSNNQNVLNILGATSGGVGNSFEVREANSGVASLPSFTTVVANTNYRIAGAYASGNYGASLNGGTAATSTATALPTGLTHLNIGSSDGGQGAYLNGHIRKVAYWPKRLTNTLLQQITT